jgi:predicted TIM-barrel fold metal-dependent hydrolase
MLEMRIERAILSLATPFVTYEVSAAVAREAAELFNNEISAICKLAPDQFAAWAYLPMQDPQAAARELRRAVSELGLVGGYVSSNVNGRYLDMEELTPLFAAASDLDAPLFVHPTNPPERERMGKYELAVVAGYLFDTTLNIFHMIFGGLFDKFPDIQMCCAHLGGYAPLLHARMQRELIPIKHSPQGSRDYYAIIFGSFISTRFALTRTMHDRWWRPMFWIRTTSCSVAIPPSRLARQTPSALSNGVLKTMVQIAHIEYCIVTGRLS